MVSEIRSAPVHARPSVVISDTITGLLSNAPPGASERAVPAVEPESRPPYACPKCGHLLRVSGVGRHRVYFEFDDNRADHPITNRVCPECGHGLPGKNPR